jgi:ATP-binding cassette subfamily B protein
MSMQNKKNISIFRFVYTMLKPFRIYFWIQVIIAILWAIDLAVRPLLVKMMLNKAAVIPVEKAFEELLPLAATYMIIGFIMICLFRLHDWCWLKISAPIRKHIGMVAMDHMLSQSHSFYQNNFAGSLSNRINDVITHVPTLLKISLDAFFSHAVSIIFAILALASVATYFAVGMLIWVSIFLLFSFAFARYGAQIADQAADRKTSVVGFIVDILSNMMNVRLFNGKYFELEKLNTQFARYVTLDQKMKWFYLYIYLFQGVSFAIFQSICFWWLIDGFSKGMITPGDFSLTLSINLSIVNNLWYLSKDIKDFSESYGAVVQGLRTVEHPIELTDIQGASELIVTGGQIVFEKVQFHYKGALPFFNDKSVVIPSGQKVGLVGPSGSGKSTFVSLIERLYDVNSGRISIDGQDIKLVTQESLRASIAVIPQEPVLFHRSLMANIRYSNRVATDEEVIAAAQMAHAHEFIIRQSEGYNTMVGERGGKLSGGQRQRIAIARAFLKKPKILILDEATSSLDSATEAGIQESLYELMQGITTLVIAHRLPTLLHMDRILVFDQGKIVEDGTHEELLEKDGLYAALWNAQIGGLLPATKE